MEEPLVQGVQALGLVVLTDDRAPFCLVGEGAEQKPGLDEPAVFLQGGVSGAWPRVASLSGDKH